MAPCFVIEMSENYRKRLGHGLFAFDLIIVLISVGCLIPYYHLATRLSLLKHVSKYGPESLRLLLMISIVVSCVMHTSGACLCLSTTSERNRFIATGWLTFWLVTLLSVLWIPLMTAILALTQRNPFISSLKEELLVAMLEYKHHVDMRVGVDRLQIDLACCGVYKYTDWLKISWQDDPPLDVTSENFWPVIDEVPFSCCNVKFPGPCLRHRPKDRPQISPISLATFYTEGCRFAIQSSINKTFLVILVLQLIIFLLELLVVVMTQYLVTGIATSYLSEDPMLPSLGWLFDHFGSLKNEKDVRAEEARDRLTANVIAAAWKKIYFKKKK